MGIYSERIRAKVTQAFQPFFIRLLDFCLHFRLKARFGVLKNFRSSLLSANDSKVQHDGACKRQSEIE